MNAACRLEGCTVLQTGVCALENDIDKCTNRVLELDTVLGDDTVEDLGAAVLDSPNENPGFPPSMALGLHTVDKMMASRYATVVGILGDPESGKTACLVSLYLLVSHAKLSGWSFADSHSLLAFEEIARGARRWKDGHPPDQMTVHTELSDDRQPGLLHLRLRRDADGRTFDLFLPDLPGEWTKDLIKNADYKRFDFMKSADVVWLMTDGRALIKREGRQGTIHRINLLMGRLAKLFNHRAPRLILVPTHRDHGEIPTTAVHQIRTETAKFGLPFEVVPVASFSKDEGVVRPGYGLAELIDATVRSECELVPLRVSTPARATHRTFLSYRRSE